MASPIRYRRCPNCETIRPASEFRRGGGPTSVIRGQQRRRCPACGFIGPLLGFPIVERPDPNRGETP